MSPAKNDYDSIYSDISKQVILASMCCSSYCDKSNIVINTWLSFIAAWIDKFGFFLGTV